MENNLRYRYKIYLNELKKKFYRRDADTFIFYKEALGSFLNSKGINIKIDCLEEFYNLESTNELENKLQEIRELIENKIGEIK